MLLPAVTVRAAVPTMQCSTSGASCHQPTLYISKVMVGTELLCLSYVYSFGRHLCGSMMAEVLLKCRQHRAALQIQAAWRGRLARQKYLATRRGVVALQVQPSPPTYPISDARIATNMPHIGFLIVFLVSRSKSHRMLHV